MQSFSSPNQPKIAGEQPRSFRLARSLVAIAAVLAGWVLFAGRAEASCGYYVVSGKPSTEMVANLQSMPMKQHANAPADCPCRGPQCHAGDSGGAMPVTATPTSTDHTVAMVLGTQTASDDVRGVCALGHITFASEAHLLSLDPPPKA
jgi:hypothetical protein